MIIRNDDVAFDTNVAELKWFCELCDKYGHQILQCITPLGILQPIDYRMSNQQIVALGGKNTIFDNLPLMDFMRSRQRNMKDLYAVHGLWHSHVPSYTDIFLSKAMIQSHGFYPTFFVPPFNEGAYPEKVHGLTVSQLTQRLEDYHPGGSLENEIPTDEIVYLHSWRYGTHYPKGRLEQCLERISRTTA